jgi:DNA (cytosine-5)-methyltransferase 1
MRQPRLLDLFCKAGGASAGYARAGFEVVGVDIEPQPRYPFEFHQGDAVAFLLEHYREYDAIGASPPCRDHTALTSRVGKIGNDWLLPLTRAMLDATGKPYIIENVVGAPMRADVVLCGEMFGLRTVRHRLFESNIPMTGIPHPAGHRAPTATSRRRERWSAGWNVSITGDVGVYVGPAAMGIDWMTGDELSNAIPPAYTEYLGWQLMFAIADDDI